MTRSGSHAARLATLLVATLPVTLAACGGGATSPDAGPADGAGSVVDAPVGADAASIFYPSNIDRRDADALKALVARAAAASQTTPLVCSFTALTAAGTAVSASAVHYAIDMAAVDIGGPEADARRDYSLLFRTAEPIPNPDDPTMPIDGSQSMIVSYIEFVDPSLVVTGDEYVYEFIGSLKDRLTVDRGTTGDTVARIVFTKLDGSGTVRLAITCAP